MLPAFEIKAICFCAKPQVSRRSSFATSLYAARRELDRQVDRLAGQASRQRVQCGARWNLFRGEAGRGAPRLWAQQQVREALRDAAHVSVHAAVRVRPQWPEPWVGKRAALISVQPLVQHRCAELAHPKYGPRRLQAAGDFHVPHVAGTSVRLLRQTGRERQAGVRSRAQMACFVQRRRSDCRKSGPWARSEFLPV